MRDVGQISFQIHQNMESEFRFEQGMLIFFGLKGRSVFSCGTTEYELEEAGILVIHPFELFSFRALNGASVICLNVSRSLLKVAGWDERLRCSCYARKNNREQTDYDRIRTLYAQIFQYYFLKDAQASSLCTRSAMELIGLLQTKFAVADDQSVQPGRESSLQRLQHILNYVNEEWNQDISLADIAKKEFLSLSYLSRFFKKHLNITFTQYITDLRLRHAVQMLIDGEMSVTNIAYECGFKNVSAFIEQFKQNYGKTPKVFRQEYRVDENAQERTFPQFGNQNHINVLLDYAPAPETVKLPQSVKQIAVRGDESGIALQHNWKTLLNIGYAHDGLLASVQRQILQAQKEIGFEFLRFHGLFDKDMHIYQEDSGGIPRFEFAYMDLLFDFILSANLKPYIEFSFMPAQIAKEMNQIFDRPSLICGCSNLNKWKRLVHETLRHLIERYGLEQVNQWRFAAISQSYVHLKCISAEDYEALYCETYQVVKGIDRGLAFGGPGCFAEMVQDEQGLSAFLRMTEERGCIPDFIGFQCYPYQNATDDLQFMNFTISQESAPSILSKNPDFMANTLKQLGKVLDSHGMSEMDIFIDECNSTLWQRDLSGDTCYKAAWLAKNICENYSRYKAFGYWMLTDLMEERTALERVFHGGYGLFTYNGIPKAGYQMMKLLTCVGDRLIARGDGWFVTRQGNHYQILIYNCCHYGSLYRYRYKRLKSPEEAYTVFENGEEVKYQFSFTDIPPGEYRLERRYIKRTSGSSFDRWIELGAPSYLSIQEQQYLTDISQPVIHAETISVTDKLRFESTVCPNEVTFLILRKIDNRMQEPWRDL